MAIKNKPKKQFTFEEHQSLGEELYIINLRLLCLECELQEKYGRKLSKLANHAGDAINKLRSELDDRVFVENKELTTSELAGAYYCANRLKDV